jgi:hypothetical protein
VPSMLTLENSGTAIQIQSTVSISSPSVSLDWNGIPAAHLYTPDTVITCQYSTSSRTQLLVG